MRNRKMQSIEAHIIRTTEGADPDGADDVELRIDVLGAYEPEDRDTGTSAGVYLTQILTPGVELTEAETAEAELALWESWHDGGCDDF